LSEINIDWESIEILITSCVSSTNINEIFRLSIDDVELGNNLSTSLREPIELNFYSNVVSLIV
jgi:hypothetical protein